VVRRGMRPHVAVIDPATRIPELDCFNRMNRRSPVSLTYHLPALHGLDSLRLSEEGLLGLVILGSGASVNESYPWQEELREWLHPRLLGGLPSLGLCYGHQLIAQILGGRVAYVHEDRRKELGVREVSLGHSRLWGAARSGPLVVTHREMVVEVPDQMEVIASTDRCPVEVLVHRTLPIASFQTHPEATGAFLRNNSVPWPLPSEALQFGNGLVDEFLGQIAS
jgi:GMP synthase-like glutamine amidotransferase